MVDGNPRFKAALENCLVNFANFMKYISDPEIVPLIFETISKLQF